jgi:hypothetical protein
VTRERAFEASGGAVQTLALKARQGQGQGKTPEYGGVGGVGGSLGPGRRSSAASSCKQRPGDYGGNHVTCHTSESDLMAAPRHHACAVHEKEATSGRADLRIDEKSSTIQEAVQPRDQGSERKTQPGKFHEGITESKDVERRDNLFRSLALPLASASASSAFCGATLKAKNDAVRAPIGHGSEVC